MINPTAVDDVVGAIEAELGRGADYTLETIRENRLYCGKPPTV